MHRPSKLPWSLPCKLQVLAHLPLLTPRLGSPSLILVHCIIDGNHDERHFNAWRFYVGFFGGLLWIVVINRDGFELWMQESGCAVVTVATWELSLHKVYEIWSSNPRYMSSFLFLRCMQSVSWALVLDFRLGWFSSEVGHVFECFWVDPRFHLRFLRVHCWMWIHMWVRNMSIRANEM